MNDPHSWPFKCLQCEEMYLNPKTFKQHYLSKHKDVFEEASQSPNVTLTNGNLRTNINNNPQRPCLDSPCGVDNSIDDNVPFSRQSP